MPLHGSFTRRKALLPCWGRVVQEYMHDQEVPAAAWQGSMCKNPKTRNFQTGSVSLVREITERMLH